MTALEGLSFRPARPGDLGGILEVFRAANDASGGRYAPSVTAREDSIGTWFLRKRLDQSWVAVAGPKVVGHIGLRRDRRPARAWGLPDASWVELSRLAVSPEVQGRGVGRALIELVEEYTRDPLWATTHRGGPGEALLTARGWTPTDLPISWSDDPTPGVLLLGPEVDPQLAGT